MLILCLLPLLSLVAAQQVESINKDEWLEMHNKLRRQEGAADMREMVWNDELATFAQQYAAGCYFEHPKDKSPIGVFKSTGQNLAIASSKPTAESVVAKQWYAEKKNFDIGSNTCRGVCGHYTQVVWAGSCSVGCGVALCDTIMEETGPYPRKNMYHIVCHYGPPGNFNSNPPFTIGEACSKCSGTCNNGLCAGECKPDEGSSGGTEGAGGNGGDCSNPYPDRFDEATWQELKASGKTSYEKTEDDGSSWSVSWSCGADGSMGSEGSKGADDSKGSEGSEGSDDSKGSDGSEEGSSTGGDCSTNLYPEIIDDATWHKLVAASETSYSKTDEDGSETSLSWSC